MSEFGLEHRLDRERHLRGAANEETPMQKTRMLESTNRPTSTAAAWLALSLTVLTVVLLAALHLASPEFDPSWRMVSEYALGRYPWLLSLMFLSWGVGTWALAAAIRPHIAGRAGRAGLIFLVIAGLGEVMAAVFDINQDLGHGMAGLLGVGGLPIAAVLVTRALPRDGSWASARRPLMGMAVLTWLAVATLMASLILMTIQVAQAYGGRLPDVAPATLPPGVFRLAGWADRLIVVSNGLWVLAVAWRATLMSRSRTRRPPPVAVTVRVDAGRSAPAS
jgi:hypothetical protein